jgi:hypothetical protein
VSLASCCAILSCDFTSDNSLLQLTNPLSDSFSRACHIPRAGMRLMRLSLPRMSLMRLSLPRSLASLHTPTGHMHARNANDKQHASPRVLYQHLLTHRTRVQHTAEDQGAGSRRDAPDTGRARAVSPRGAAAETRFLVRRALAQTAIGSTATAALQFSRMREWTL